MSADNRTTLTDAVATLGTLIDPAVQKRDAIHLATEPVIAAEKLYPGQDIGLNNDGKATLRPTKLVGIVDPFLKGPVMPGEAFWLIVYPRCITSLRHTWEHPDFAPENAVFVEETKPTQPESEIVVAFRRIAEQAANRSISYTELMCNARDYEGDNEIYTSNGYFTADDDFWADYSTITGRHTELSYMDDGCRGC